MACCPRGGLRAQNFGPNPEYPPPPLQVRTVIAVSAEKEWRRDAGKLPLNRGKSAVYIYTLLILLTGLITYCSPLVLIRLIIWTRTLLIKHHLKSEHTDTAVLSVSAGSVFYFFYFMYVRIFYSFYLIFFTEEVNIFTLNQCSANLFEPLVNAVSHFHWINLCAGFMEVNLRLIKNNKTNCFLVLFWNNKCQYVL